MTWSRPIPARRLRPRLLARGGVAALVVAAAVLLVVLAALGLAAAGGFPESPAGTETVRANATLERCRALGGASGDDTACRLAWARARRAFFDGSEGRP